MLEAVNIFYEGAIKECEKKFHHLNDIENRVVKLKKGSLKTIIYYYSEDFNLDPVDFRFEAIRLS